MSDRAEITRIRYVTEHFEVLQGLAAIPAIAWCGVAIAWANGWVAGWLVLVGAGLAAPAAWAGVRHYRRTYGQVRPLSGASRQTVWFWPCIGLITAVTVIGEIGLDGAVSAEGVVLFGGALLGAWFERPLAPALVAVGGIGMVASLVPLGGIDGPHPLSDTETWIFAFCLAVAVVAVWGHLLLRRTLGSSGEQ